MFIFICSYIYYPRGSGDPRGPRAPSSYITEYCFTAVTPFPAVAPLAVQAVCKPSLLYLCEDHGGGEGGLWR